MTSLAAILDSFEPIEDGWHVAVPGDWLQGRTAYGGLSAALALGAAKRSVADLPPLRSAQIAFVGPVSGAVTLRAQLLRRGRNAAFIRAEVSGEVGPGLQATFVFIQDRESAIMLDGARAPDFAAPEPGAEVFRGLAAVPFTQRFEMVDRGDQTVGEAEWLRWLRLAERDPLDPEIELLAVADALPPAAMKLAEARRAPVSTVTWQMDVLVPRPTSDNGWWLLQSAADHVAGGVCNQRMAIWDSGGRAVATQLQSVMVFA